MANDDMQYNWSDTTQRKQAGGLESDTDQQEQTSGLESDTTGLDSCTTVWPYGNWQVASPR